MPGMVPLYFSNVDLHPAIGWAFIYILPEDFFWTSLAVAGPVVKIFAGSFVSSSCGDQSANTGKARRTAKPKINHHNR
jgi:hypothetical protein